MLEIRPTATPGRKGRGASLSRSRVSGVTQITDHLAALTGYRDRDLIDVTLAGAFHELLRPRSVAVYRTIGGPEDPRWMTRARHCAEEMVACADPPWTDLSTLPPIAQFPARCQALAGETVMSSSGGVHYATFPLTTDRDVVGVIEFETNRALESSAHNLIRSILRIYRNFQSLLDYSEHDTLTGLLNRKSFDETFFKIIAAPGAGDTQRSLAPADRPNRRAFAPEERLWLGMIDIDFFKSVNDQFGHLIGDEVLLLLSRLMRSSFRADDRLYRFGGEEFVVLMRCKCSREVARVFERCRLAAEQHLFPQVGHITVSIGYTEVKCDDSPAAALGRADKAAYYAKEHGRNQIRSYSELTARGALEVVENIGAVELF